MKKLLTRIRNFTLGDFVIFSIVNVILYTVAEFISGFYAVQHETLTQYFFGVFGGECLFCALIKIFKLKRSQEDEEDD